MLLAGEIAIPPLATLARRASWVNRAGNVDRSACIDIRAREVSRLVFPSGWKRAINAQGRIARADITIHALHLLDWLAFRSPQQLQGDFRTPKSNAMKRASDPQRRRHKPAGAQSWRAITDARGGTYCNPNKGAAATKRFSHTPHSSRTDLSRRMPPRADQLFAWSQSLTLERFRLKSRTRRPAHDKSNPPDPIHSFLICPVCRTRRRTLLMPVAHEQELNDAHLAQSWLRFIDAHPRWRTRPLNDTALRAHITIITTRYALLFEPRRFICIECLGARHGEVKRSRRPRKPTIVMPPPTPDGSSEMPMPFRLVYKQLRDAQRRANAVDQIVHMFRAPESKNGAALGPELLTRMMTAGPRNYSPLLRAMRSKRNKRRKRRKPPHDQSPR